MNATPPNNTFSVTTDELQVGLCEECAEDGQVLDRVLLQHFELRVCVTCKQDRNLREGAYELIPKSRAKTEFALPESFFHGMPHMTKPNPHHESFAPLKLYLKTMVMNEAHRLYESEEGLEKEKAARKARSYNSAAKRTKHLLKRKHVLLALDGDHKANKERDHETDKQPTKQPKKPAYISVADRDHKHQFAAESFDKAMKAWFKKCTCGMKVEVEKW